MSEVLLVSRANCHLCDEARPIVQAVARETGHHFAEVDVDQDAQLRSKYSDEVPVVLIDGVQHAFWRVDADRLRKALAPESGSS
ncbi:glutaredoxin family protein [Saxibacter everestensis]|uniref:Glutaredoxin family protein n=1 Tax=Saxibacter everestensis TaxID=2909229 RepID=A0ABY8QS34_9MICO|nr:glutaredoxin family protein [Brevibacteriaceae bacterium ZFBP1038]